MQTDSDFVNLSHQLRHEIHAVIRRYGQESDATVYQAIAAIECVKLDLWDMLQKSNQDKQ